MPNLDNLSSAPHSGSTSYVQLIKFLLEPLLDQPESLSVDCEQLPNSNRVWLRVAFDQEDKGKVFGRGGRNLRAIETILRGSTPSTDQKIYLDVYGSHDHSAGGGDRPGGSANQRRGDSRRSQPPRRSRTPKPSPQLRGPNGNP
ncbi:KH domain-containing protein [Picosynechococcus sp. NKBG15041c]|uniref:KH domain-containing protein n=1 Tax=Picosynechococcus sp. NKBG15041c TaxID=1407650 RepID=UPI000466D81D|nr:KH domain-containing protein [Picosynechococcus sp. NKBG15041c]